MWVKFGGDQTKILMKNIMLNMHLRHVNNGKYINVIINK